MKKEIRKDVREYILSQVNESLTRLGVSEKVEEYNINEVRYKDKMQYEFKSAPIRQMPVMFKKLIVSGYMMCIEAQEGDFWYKANQNRDIVVVNLSYRYQHFDMGSNGCEIGRMLFLVDKELPKSFESKIFDDVARNYIFKAEGLQI